MKLHLIITVSFFVAACYLNLPADTRPDHVDPIVEVQPEPETEPVKTAIIEMQLADWCGPCRRFKASGAVKELKAQGWKIKYTDGIAKSYPSFKVWVDGKSAVFSGYSSKTSFFRTLKKHIKELKND